MTDDTAIPLGKQRSLGSSRDPIERWLKTENSQRTVRSLYVHIPFCFHKCHYCDFYSIVDRQDRQEAFVDRMVDEIRAQTDAIGQTELDTVFIGGGTPTLLSPPLLSRLLGSIESKFEIQSTTEWTIETNPETLSDEIVSVLKDSSVNRISMGAQSFNAVHLKALERHHDPESVYRSIDRAKNAGFDRLSLDLIYGIPNQTLKEWNQDLQHALDLPIDHLSAYALTYEPNTAMTARLHRGEFSATPDELEVKMYNSTLEHIREHGFERYEVSNHAKPGNACQHNIAYWEGKNWLAIGPSASGHLDGYRWKNTPRLEEYNATSDLGFAPVCEIEESDPRTMLMDRLMMGIRVSSGLDQQAAINAANVFDCGSDIQRVIDQCIEIGWVESIDEHWVLTDSGFHFADRVARELIGVLVPS